MSHSSLSPPGHPWVSHLRRADPCQSLGRAEDAAGGTNPALAVCGYLPGRARSPSSSGTRHGTAATPRRFSPAPWPRRAARAGSEPPLPPGTAATPRPQPGPHRHRGEQAHPGELDKAPQGSGSKHVPHGCSQCRGAPGAGQGSPVLVRGEGTGTARLCQPPVPGTGRDVLPEPAEEILAMSWAAPLPCWSQNLGEQRAEQPGWKWMVLDEAAQLPPSAASPEGSKPQRDSGRDIPRATAATPGSPGAAGTEGSDSLGSHQAGTPNQLSEPHHCWPRPLPAQPGAGEEEQLHHPGGSPSLQPGPTGLSPTRVPSRSLRRLTRLPMSRYSRYSRQPGQCRCFWQPRCPRCHRSPGSAR